ncbi:MAG: macrolide transporter subunit MacA, partial [Serratia symbiotica]|nr:macrolide transporter subunit MacA [Serratia symbiotica]
FEVPNPAGMLRLQMTAQVHIQLAGVRQAQVIPLTALGDQIADNRYPVSVLKQGKEEKREVTIGLRNDIDVQILSGLQLGEEVIISRSGVGDS